YYDDSARLAQVPRPRRWDGSPGGQKPHRRSPGRIDLSARAVRRGAVPAAAVFSAALRPRGLLAGLSHLAARGQRRGARVPRRGEVPAVGRAVHLRREPARRSLALPHDAPALAHALLHPRHRASRGRPLVLPGARLRDRAPGRAVPHGRSHRGEGVRFVRAQPRGPRGPRPPHLQLAHRVARSIFVRSGGAQPRGSTAIVATVRLSASHDGQPGPTRYPEDTGLARPRPARPHERWSGSAYGAVGRRGRDVWLRLNWVAYSRWTVGSKQARATSRGTSCCARNPWISRSAIRQARGIGKPYTPHEIAGNARLANPRSAASASALR